VKPKEVPTAGFYGNPYENYISIFDTPGLKAKESKAGVDFFDITPGRSETGGFQEEFWNSVKPLISVSSPNVPSHKQPAGPFGGQIGAAASVLAGHAIRVAGKSLTESSISSPPKQSTIERAILAESTLQAISSLPSSQIIQLGITQKTESIWSSLASAAKSIAPKLLPVLVEPVLNLLQDVTRKGTTEGAFNITEKVVDIPGTAPFSSSRNGFKDDFMKKLLAPTVKRTGEESIWDGLGSLVGSALSGGGALGIGLNVLSSLIPHGEASFQETPIDQNLSVLAKRATLAEATLQALQDNYNTTTDQAAKNITEGLFSKIIDAVQKIAPAVIKYAPQVADAVVPVVTNLLKSSPEVTILSKTKSANGLDSSTKTTNESLQEQADDRKFPFLQVFSLAKLTRADHGAITKKVPFVNGFASELSLADAAEAGKSPLCSLSLQIDSISDNWKKISRTSTKPQSGCRRKPGPTSFHTSNLSRSPSNEG
jgi:hypothetical protein